MKLEKKLFKIENKNVIEINLKLVLFRKKKTLVSTVIYTTD